MKRGLTALLAHSLFAACMALCAGNTACAESVGQLVTRAQHRDVAAMRTLGIRMYKGGYAGIPTNRKVGLQWLNMAAEKDDDVALLFLGDIYAKGFHVPMDKGKAEDYYRRAKAAGSQNADARLAKLGVKSGSRSSSSSRKYEDDDDDDMEEYEEEDDKPATKKSASKTASAPQTPVLMRLTIDRAEFTENTPMADVIDAVEAEARRKNMTVSIDYTSNPAFDEEACVDSLSMEGCTAVALLQEACRQSGCEMKISQKGATIKQIKEISRKSKTLTYEERQQLLMKTIAEGDSDKVEEMLSKPLNLSYLDSDDMSPLMYAVKRDQIRIATMLLAKGANVNQVNRRGETALLLAVRSNQEAIARELIEHGADVNRRYEHQGTALMYAVSRESATIAKLLLDAGANADAADDENITAQILAEATGNQALINLMSGSSNSN